MGEEFLFIRARGNYIGELIDAIFAAADFFGLLEIESKKKSDMHALAADAATYWILKEEETREITGAEARCTQMI